MSASESLFTALPQDEAERRIDCAMARIARVKVRLLVLEKAGEGPFPSEIRILQEAMHLLDPDYHLA